MTEAHVLEVFSKFGTVKAVEVKANTNFSTDNFFKKNSTSNTALGKYRSHRKHAIVHFEKKDEAQKAFIRSYRSSDVRKLLNDFCLPTKSYQPIVYYSHIRMDKRGRWCLGNTYLELSETL